MFAAYRHLSSMFTALKPSGKMGPWALTGYAFYSAYACMVPHSQTALSPIASLGDTLSGIFLASLLVGKALACASALIFPYHAIPKQSVASSAAISCIVASVGFTISALALHMGQSGSFNQAIHWIAAAGILIGIGDTLLVLIWVHDLTALPIRDAFSFLILSVMGGVLLYYACTFFPDAMMLPVSLTFFLMSLLCAFSISQSAKTSEGEWAPPAYDGIASALLQPALGVATLGFMAGLILQISGQAEVGLPRFQGTSVIANEIVYGIVFLLITAFPRQFDLSRIYQITFPLAAAGFLLLALIWNSAGGIANSFVQLGYTLTMRILCCLIAESARNDGPPSFRTAAACFLALNLAQLTGTVIGLVYADTLTFGSIAFTAAAVTAAYILLCTVLFLFRERRFRAIEKSETRSKPDSARPDIRCTELAQTFDLTDREEEILVLLSHGHTVKAVAQYLYLSDNTVKFYVKNIYQKIGVHTRQELIDLLNPQDAQNRNDA